LILFVKIHVENVLLELYVQKGVLSIVIILRREQKLNQLLMI